MQKTENKTTNSVRSKLVAAIAMLLVATIMVVSSTYAWFTLSTKPEVTGISTAVGANGALEMLLATKDANGNWVYGKGTVNSEDDKVRNTYWGNLVDLSDAAYGSGFITLYPSLLNVTNGAINTGAPISTPVYGADGRVNSVKEGGMFGIYDVDEKAFLRSTNYGFRAVGNASGLTARQQAFRVALSKILVSQSSAQSKARTSLSANGNTLAAIAVKKAMGTSDSFTDTEIAAVGSMITGIKEALAAVEDGYLQFIYAYLNSTESGLEDGEVTDAIDDMEEAISKLTTSDLGDKVEAALGAIGKDTDILPTYSNFEASVAAVAQAEDAYNDLTKTGCNWSELSGALTHLVKVDAIKINDVPANLVKEKTSEIINQVVSGKGLNVKMVTGGGVYADIADFAGDYTVGIEINTELLGTGFDLGTVPATMKAETTYKPAILTSAKKSIEGKEHTGDGTIKPITEFYGYVVDLAFRTNAATSNLLLQTAPADRIYTGNQNTETAGKGSTMTFATTDANFTKDAMLGLMSRLNVVFYDTLSGTILAKAKLDTAAKNVEGTATDGITANLYVVKEVEEEVTKDDGSTETVIREELVTEQTDAVITGLDTNDEKHVSVLVYLDGEGIENKDVAASAMQSMSGTFNIQFASSADLQPMEYSDLHTTAPSGN